MIGTENSRDSVIRRASSSRSGSATAPLGGRRDRDLCDRPAPARPRRFRSGCRRPPPAGCPSRPHRCRPDPRRSAATAQGRSRSGCPTVGRCSRSNLSATGACDLPWLAASTMSAVNCCGVLAAGAFADRRLRLRSGHGRRSGARVAVAGGQQRHRAAASALSGSSWHL